MDRTASRALGDRVPIWHSVNGGNAVSNPMHASKVDGISQVDVDSGSRVFLPASDASFADEIKFFPGQHT